MSMPHIAGAEQADRRQHGEPPADAVGHFERAVAFLVADLAQRAAGRVGRREDVVLVLLAELLLQQVAEEDELRRRLGGLAALADDVDDRLLDLRRDQVDRPI